MLTTTKSFKDFKRVIASSSSYLKSERPTELGSGGELCIESRVDDDLGLLGLESERSKLTDKAVKSSIDSEKKKKSNNSSIPLSELILRDTGFDYLFTVDSDPKKLEKKYHRNLRQLKTQTEEMADLVRLKLIELENREIQSKIQTLEKQLSRIRAKRKSRSPVPQYSDYLCYAGRKRQERLTGKLIAAELRKSRSNMKTQCDSKAPSLPSAPATPTPRPRLLLNPQKQFLKDYFSILQSKKEAISNSIATLGTFFTQRVDEGQRENNAYHKQIMLLDAQTGVGKTPVRKSKFRCTVGPLDSSSRSHNKSHRRLIGFHSPRESRQQKKSQMGLLSRGRRQFLSNPREEYFILN